MKEVNLFIAMPSGATVYADTMMSMVGMMQYLYSKRLPKGFYLSNVIVNNIHSSVLATGRDRLVDLALDQNATHLLFIDSDQTFPKDMAHRLIGRDKAVIGCNVATRALPSNPTARLKYSPEPYYGRALFTSREDKGIRQVWRLGTGIMMVKTDILRKMSKPRFPYKWHEEIQELQGEDWGFCERLEEMDIPIYVDQPLSYEIGHIGIHNFKHETIENQRLIDSMHKEAG